MPTFEEMQITIPPSLMEFFAKKPRIVVKPWPGLIPIDFAMLKNHEFLAKLADDVEIKKNFDLMLVPRSSK